MTFAPWQRLPPGALIAVVAPAGPADADRVAQVPALIEAQGWRARMTPSCTARSGFLAGPDAQRLDDLQAALADPAVAAVWCLRGGYGSGRLLPALAAARTVHALRARPKPLIGYSDITALHALLDGAGLLALHAPMPASDLLLPGRDADAAALFGLLRNGLAAGTCWALPPQPPVAPVAPDGRAERPTADAGDAGDAGDTDGAGSAGAGAPPLRVPGIARGRLQGGNLSLMAALCGTPWQLKTAGRLLFIEDIGEPPYRVDRLLWQLGRAGLLAGAAGFLLGSFTDADNPLPVLREHLGALGKPVLGGWPAGHGTPHRPLPLGALATLDAGAGTLTIEQDVLV